MLASEFEIAWQLARSEADLANWVGYDDVLFGYGLSNFEPVEVPIQAVARMLRWQCINLDGSIDPEAFAQERQAFVYPRRKVTVTGICTCLGCGKIKLD
jgi:hypothetical protein